MAAGAGVLFFLVYFAFIGVMMVFSIGGFVLWVLGLIDVFKRPDWQFRQYGLERTTWIVVLLVTGALGGFIYRFGPPSRLRGVPIPPSLPAAPPPGWYPDPQGAGQAYWDGAQWTGHRA